MTAKRGYYSLVQFCPSPARAEGVNLGVILFCPDAGFLEVRMAASNRAATKLVGRTGVDPAELNAAKRAIECRLRVNRDSFQNPEDFQRFAETRANVLRLTTPRSIKIVQPELELEQLFQELVGGHLRLPRSSAALPSLDSFFRKLEQQNRARLNVTVTVPVEGRPLQVPYAYRNGTLNLVKPQVFSNQEAMAVSVAVRLAVAGDLLQRHGEDEEGTKRLVVVSSFQPSLDVQVVKDRVSDLLREYKVRMVCDDMVDSFVAEVEREAH